MTLQTRVTVADAPRPSTIVPPLLLLAAETTLAADCGSADDAGDDMAVVGCGRGAAPGTGKGDGGTVWVCVVGGLSEGGLSDWRRCGLSASSARPPAVLVADVDDERDDDVEEEEELGAAASPPSLVSAPALSRRFVA